MNLEKKYTLIEKYLANELQGDELEKFKTQLQNDSELNKELTLHRQLTETLKGDKVHDLRAVLNDVDKNWNPPSKKPNSAKVINLNLRRVLTIAAAITLFVICYQWFSIDNQSSQEVYATNFEPYPMLLNQRSIDENTIDETVLQNAISNYAKGQNGEALVAFEKLLKVQPDNITYQFYQANLYLSNKNAEVAIPIFQKILADGNPIFIEQTRWYLALAHLQNNDKENAKLLLQKIHEGQYKYHKSQEILENL